VANYPIFIRGPVGGYFKVTAAAGVPHEKDITL